MRKARIDCRSARIRVALGVIDHADYESDVSFCRGPPEGTPLKKSFLENFEFSEKSISESI